MRFQAQVMILDGRQLVGRKYPSYCWSPTNEQIPVLLNSARVGTAELTKSSDGATAYMTARINITSDEMVARWMDHNQCWYVGVVGTQYTMEATNPIVVSRMVPEALFLSTTRPVDTRIPPASAVESMVRYC